MGKNIKTIFGRFYFKTSFSPQYLKYLKLNKTISLNCKPTSRYSITLWKKWPEADKKSLPLHDFSVFCWEHEEAGHRYLQMIPENSWIHGCDLKDYFFTCPVSPLLWELSIAHYKAFSSSIMMLVTWSGCGAWTSWPLWSLWGGSLWKYLVPGICINMETPAAKIGWDIPQYRAPNLFKFQEMSTSPYWTWFWFDQPLQPKPETRNSCDGLRVIYNRNRK